MGNEMVASLPPLRIWKSEAEGNPAGTGAIETGEGDASLLLRAAVDALEFRLGPGLEVSRSNFDRSNFLFLGSILPSNSGHLCGNSARLALTAAAQPSAAPGILMIHDWRPWGVTGSLGCCRRVWAAFFPPHPRSATFPSAHLRHTGVWWRSCSGSGCRQLGVLVGASSYSRQAAQLRATRVRSVRHSSPSSLLLRNVASHSETSNRL